VGDVPHRLENLFEYLEGERPALSVLARGPAALAIRLAEAAFPVMQQGETADRHPLMRVPPKVVRGDAQPPERGRRWQLAVAAGWALLTGLGFLFVGRRP
jgi:hypothetical protein